MNRKIFNYKGVRTNRFGIPVATKDRPNAAPARRQYLRNFIFEFPKNSPKNLLLIYDIPHTLKRERDWFRRQLKSFDFIMIQKSVWVGPSPLPADFTAYLKVLGLQKEFKTFKLAMSYTKKN